MLSNKMASGNIFFSGNISKQRKSTFGMKRKKDKVNPKANPLKDFAPLDNLQMHL